MTRFPSGLWSPIFWCMAMLLLPSFAMSAPAKKKPAARKKAVSARKAPVARRKTAAQPRVAPGTAAEPDKKVLPARKAKTTKKAKATKKAIAVKTRKPAPRKVVKPLPVDKSVTTATLKNGLIHWCKQRKEWTQTHLTLAIGAGAANDPRGLYGRSRYLSHLLRRALNLPVNPAKSNLAVGAAEYKVQFGKEWITIRAIFPNAQLDKVLRHVGDVLQKVPPASSVQALRQRLIRTSRGYPPASMSEKLEVFLFPGQPRSVYLRGKTRTFQSIKPLALQTAYEKLVRGERSRLLIAGGQDCATVQKSVLSAFKGLRGKKSQKPVLPAPAPVLASSRNGRFLINQRLVRIFSLPSMDSGSVARFQMVRALVLEELNKRLFALYQRPVDVRSVTHIAAQGGYFVVHAPMERLLKKRVETILKSALGSLLLKPWAQGVKGRFPQHRGTVLQRWKARNLSPVGASSLLLPQLLLAGAKSRAVDTVAVLQQSQPSEVREQARRFLRSPVSLKRRLTVSSFQRIAFFFGSLFLMWFLLDFVFRRIRQGSGDE